MPFGDDGMASTTVVWNRRLVAAVAVGWKRRRGGGMSMGSLGSYFTKGVVSGQWAAEWEGVGCSRGGRGWKYYGYLSALLSSASVCGGSMEGIIWREKKDFSRGEWEITRERWEKNHFFPVTIVLGTVVIYGST